MARRKPQPAPLTRSQQIDQVRASFRDDTWLGDNRLIGEPERRFAVGQEVLLGCIKRTVVVEVLLEGKAYLVERFHDKGANDFSCCWWFELETSRNLSAPKLFQDWRHGQLLHSGLDSLLHLYYHDGLVCDPEFQRGYVWSDADKEALLDSIFERLEIGSFTMIRHHGYSHQNDQTSAQYINLHGEIVNVPRNHDYTVSIIDGQQRLTTIVNFYLDKLTYRGIRFSELHPSDQSQFENFQVAYRLINEENITKVEILKMFLQANRGVPQTADHLAKVQALYEQEKARVST